jgi:hypothetical protein
VTSTRPRSSLRTRAPGTIPSGWRRELLRAPAPPPEPPPERPLPAWSGPPANTLGGVVALELLVARSDKAAVWLGSATVYPTGVDFALAIRWRPEFRDVTMYGRPWHYEPSPSGGLPDELFRAGIEFADGSKATTLGSGLGTTVAIAGRPDDSPEGPLLLPRGGSGGAESRSQALWLWPLPSQGPLSFVCEWPALDIGLSRTQIDAARLQEAASRSRTLWEDDRPAAGPPPTASLGP